MVKIRRWYIFLVSAISLNAVVWAIIELLRQLLVPDIGRARSDIALQLSIIIIGLPFFLGHFSWAQRLARDSEEERTAGLRYYYLYLMMGTFQIPWLVNAYKLCRSVLAGPLGAARSYRSFGPADTVSAAVIYQIIALSVLALFWAYHLRLLKRDDIAMGAVPAALEPRRVYSYLFTAGGLLMVVVAGNAMLNWLLYQIGASQAPIRGGSEALLDSVAALLVGLPLWLVSWRRVQHMYLDGPRSEQASALRKLYLYAALFAGVMIVVTNAAIILAALIRSGFGLPSMGDIRDPISLIIIGTVLWSYHDYVLKLDVQGIADKPRQAAVRRLYRYLLAGVGLAALIIGLSGEISLLIRSFDSGLLVADNMKEQFAWFTASLIAGLPVWLIPWRQLQLDASGVSELSEDERESLVRRIYLYFYLFVAAMIVLANAIVLVSQLIELALGSRQSAGLLVDVGQALAFSIIGAGLWLYHRQVMVGDSQLSQQSTASRTASLRVLMVRSDSRVPWDEMSQEIAAQFPGVTVSSIPSEAREGVPAVNDAELIQQAGIILLPVSADTDAGIQGYLRAAVSDSGALKLIIPSQPEGEDSWAWLGVDQLDSRQLLKQTALAIKQYVSGQPIEPARSMGLGNILAIIAGVLILLMVIISLVSYLIETMF